MDCSRGSTGNTTRLKDILLWTIIYYLLSNFVPVEKLSHGHSGHILYSLVVRLVLSWRLICMERFTFYLTNSRFCIADHLLLLSRTNFHRPHYHHDVLHHFLRPRGTSCLFSLLRRCCCCFSRRPRPQEERGCPPHDQTCQDYLDQP
jgi:hypothetical protein